LKSDTGQGLTIEKVNERLKHFGLNIIEEADAISLFQILGNQFKSPIVLLLLFAAGLSLLSIVL